MRNKHIVFLFVFGIDQKKKKEKKKIFPDSDYTAKLQSSKQYGTGTKIEIWVNGTG